MERDPPWHVDHLQQNHKILRAILDKDPRAPFWRWCIEETGWGKHVSEFGGGERDNGGMDPENRMSTHDLHVSVLEVECLVRSEYPFVTTLSDILA